MVLEDADPNDIAALGEPALILTVVLIEAWAFPTCPDELKARVVLPWSTHEMPPKTCARNRLSWRGRR